MRIILGLLVALAIFVAGAFVGDNLNVTSRLTPHTSPTDIIEQGTGYQFISPLLFCQDQDISDFTDSVTQDMQSQITQYINAQKNAGVLTDAAVYYRDLNNGPNLNINGNLSFPPASLLKLPTAISAYEQAEANPMFLSQHVTFTGNATSSNAGQYFSPPQQLQSGMSYTVEELVRYMLEDSDNAALTLLGSMISSQNLISTFQNLGISVPDTPQPQYTIPVKTFASFFRVLYNASYLSKDDSEHLLSLLSRSAFPQGIVAGVPSDIVVAHKFGEYDGANDQNELHDCGIVYKAHQPYLLCIMTQGTDFDKQAAVIAHISNIVYTTVDKDSQN